MRLFISKLLSKPKNFLSIQTVVGLLSSDYFRFTPELQTPINVESKIMNHPKVRSQADETNSINHLCLFIVYWPKQTGI